MLDGNPDFYSPSTRSESLPRHVAIIMDGNGRWAKRRHLPRIAGHRAGVEAVRGVIENCMTKGIEALTLFAFSSENWRRPAKEVDLLMDLFLTALQREVAKLHNNGIRLKVIGDRGHFSDKLCSHIEDAEQLTRDNHRLTLTIAASYGGRWDITQAARVLAQRVASGELTTADITPEQMESCMALHGLPEPDLFIRTGGEQRISNFVLWQLAYTELYFTDILWPDFDAKAFDAAMTSFARRQRRFGRTGEQLERVTGE